METKHSASMENYLESIIILGEGKGAVRVSQISKALGVKMPSVTIIRGFLIKMSL
jgi:Mn-dependent DtxR family transcriptional regulator